jgi:long-chain acyl-CoA synthetase
MRNRTLAKLYTKAFHNNWEKLAFSDFEGRDFQYKQIAEIVKSLHLFYQIMGFQKGDKVAILGRNSAHWGASFLSAISAGLVPVPVMPDFSEHDTNHIINHSESKIVIGSKLSLEKIDLEKRHD